MPPNDPVAEGRTDLACYCCGHPAPDRDPDQWEGRLDGYCEDCATARCDAFPGDCSKPRKDRTDPQRNRQTPMWAMLRAGSRVRGGFHEWLRGAPTHVLAELLIELHREGWMLRRIADREDS